MRFLVTLKISVTLFLELYTGKRACSLVIQWRTTKMHKKASTGKPDEEGHTINMHKKLRRENWLGRGTQ